MSTAFQDIMEIVGLNEEEIKKMNVLGFRSLNSVKAATEEQLNNVMIKAGCEALAPELIAFQGWYLKYRADVLLKQKSVEEVFTQDVWDEYMDSYLDTKKSTVTINSTPVPIVAKSPTSYEKYKLETRNLPTLPKNDSIMKKYALWEEQFLAHIGMGEGNLTEILEENYVVPTSKDEYEDYAKKDRLIKNAMLLATRDTHAYHFVKHHKTGREIFKDVRIAYQGVNHLKTRAKNSLGDYNKLTYGLGSKLSAQAFAATILRCLADMEAGGAPMAPDLVRDSFLDKITHPSFESWREVKKDNQDTFDELLLSFREKAEEVTPLTGDRVSGKTQNADGAKKKHFKKRGNGGNKDGDKKKSDSTYIQPEKWSAMTWEERKESMKKKGTWKEDVAEKTNQQATVKASGPTSLPCQYNAQQGTITMQPEGGKTVTFVPEKEITSDRARTLMRGAMAAPTQTGYFTMTAKNTRLLGTVSSMAKEFLLKSNTGNIKDGETSLCIDGGTNVSLLGAPFHVVAWSNQHADMSGFADELVVRNVRLGSGVAVTQVNGVKVMLGVHNAAIMPNNSGSLLSTGQAREHGVWLNDVLERHGGEQRLVAMDDEDNAVSVPFEVERGLFQIRLRKPTEDELNDLPTVWLTSNETTWDPSVLDEDNELVLPLVDGTTIDKNETPYMAARCATDAGEDEEQDKKEQNKNKESNKTRDLPSKEVTRGVLTALVDANTHQRLKSKIMRPSDAVSREGIAKKSVTNLATPAYDKYRPMKGLGPFGSDTPDFRGHDSTGTRNSDAVSIKATPPSKISTAESETPTRGLRN